MTGFTGEVWQRIPAEQLARDLMNGVGPVDLFESGLTWLTVESELTELTADVAHILKSLDEGWQGEGAEGMAGALRKLHTWLIETADMANRNAKAAEVQAIATTVARTTMPQASEVESLTELHGSMKAMEFPAGSMLGGGMAFVESSLKMVKAQAARVMETYEQATTPVAQPWEQVIAPTNLVKIVRGSKPEGAPVNGLLGATGGMSTAALAALTAMSGPVRRTTRTSEHNVHKQTVNPASSNQSATDQTTVGQSVSNDVVVDESARTGHAPMMGPVGATPAAAAGATGAINQLNLTAVEDGDAVVPQGDQVAAPAVFGASEGERV